MVTEIPRMPASEGDLASFQHARQARKGRNVGWREPRGGSDASFSGLRPAFWRALSSSRVDHGRTSPLVVIVHRSRSSCRERRRLWSEPIDPAQDVGQQRSWHRHLSELKHDVAPVTHDAGADLEAYGVVPERVAGQPRAAERILALLDVLFGGAAAVVELDHPLVGSDQVGHDKADPRVELALVPLDLGHHPTGSGSAFGFVVEAGIGHDRLLGPPADRPRSKWPIRRCNTWLAGKRMA